MPGTAVIGAQWGDEAKGKITHFLARDARMTVRFNGGPNAGHTVEDAHGAVKLHQVPVGALRPGCMGVIAHGAALDLWALNSELARLREQGRPEPVLLISERAHLILPHHKLREELEGSATRIGTTKRGIGPCYAERAARFGLRLCDLEDAPRVRGHMERARASTAPHGPTGGCEAHALAEELVGLRQKLGRRVIDTRIAIQQALDEGHVILFEGAQGTLLDLDLGTYPFVTSSTTTVHGVGWGTGISTHHIERVVGVAKAYTTRVGEGPMPTEDKTHQGEHLRSVGAEYGATTGRPRRCGWLDLVGLRYAHEINGFTELALTKLDVLTGLPEINVCIGYRVHGAACSGWPATIEALARVTPVYTSLPGWDQPLSDARSWEELPRAAQEYIRFVEQAVGVPVRLVGVGPAAEATIMRTA